MTNNAIQRSKDRAWAFLHACYETANADVHDVLSKYVSPSVQWRGFHPIRELTGIHALYEGYWQQLLHAFSDLRLRTDIFFGGESDGETWVCTTGYLIGTFANDWLSLPASGEETFIRFGEFHRFDADLIVETHCLLDLLDVMRQGGRSLLPDNAGRTGLVPPPAAGDGVVRTAQDAEQSDFSRELVKAMLFKGLNQYAEGNISSMNKADYWDAEMRWYGPHGIGTTYNMKEFEDYHQIPFLTGFPDRQATPHDAIIGEGRYAAAVGFPGVIGTHLGEYLGTPPTGQRIHMNLMDFWNRDGELLVENWVLIDMVDIFLQFGVDLIQF